MKKPTAFDVFSGCGGTTQGLRDAGFRVVGGVEIDALAVETFRANHRGIKVWDVDIRDVSPDVVLPHLKMKRGELDLLVGCPPCQSFSALKRLNGGKSGRDKGTKDLTYQFRRLV
jgi:DNA (cytosine-5)-methyltransferase 1